jgi:hypothetical protein
MLNVNLSHKNLIIIGENKRQQLQFSLNFTGNQLKFVDKIFKSLNLFLLFFFTAYRTQKRLKKISFSVDNFCVCSFFTLILFSCREFLCTTKSKERERKEGEKKDIFKLLESVHSTINKNT